MRRTAATLTGLAVLGSLIGGSIAAAPGYAASAQLITGLPAAPAGGCQKEPQPANVEPALPFAQELFNTERVWAISRGAGVSIAVLDTGVDVGHQQLTGSNIASGADFANGNGSGSGRFDCDGHGTAVAALIGAEKVQGVGFQGLAHGATVLPVAVTPEYDEGNPDRTPVNPDKLASAINWATGQGAKVINISVTLYEDHEQVRNAVAEAIDNDIVVVASVGNLGVKANPEQGIEASPGPIPYPAAYEGVVGVNAVDWTGRPLDTSPWGDYVDLAAPGDQILSANRGGGHIGVSGSGFAAPFVSATAALVRSKWPDLSASEVVRRLFATASPAGGTEEKVGYGMVDPYRALTETLSDEPPAALPAASLQSPDAATVARQAEWRFAGQFALATAGIGVLLAVVMLATLTLLPLGAKRRWRPGRAKPFPEPKPEGDLPPAPVRLFEDLETS